MEEDMFKGILFKAITHIHYIYLGKNGHILRKCFFSKFSKQSKSSDCCSKECIFWLWRSHNIRLFVYFSKDLNLHIFGCHVCLRLISSLFNLSLSLSALLAYTFVRKDNWILKYSSSWFNKKVYDNCKKKHNQNQELHLYKAQLHQV